MPRLSSNMPEDARAKEQDFDARLGAQVRQERTLAGLSQEKLAGRIGVTFQQVQKIEGAKNRVAFGRFVRLAHALEMRPDTLLVRTVEGTGPGGADTPHDHQLRLLAEAWPHLAPEVRAALTRTARSVALSYATDSLDRHAAE